MASQEPGLVNYQAEDREATVQKAISLFHQKQFAAASDLFIQARAPPDQVLALYPERIFDLPPPISASLQVLSGDDLHFATKHLIPYLAQMRKDIQRYLNFDGTLKTPLDLQDPLLSRLLPTSVENPEEPTSNIEARLLTIARRVDTSLFLSLLHSNPSLISSLLRLPNFCDADVVCHELWEAQRYDDLLTFYTSRNLHREVLELLLALGKGGYNGGSFNGPGRTITYIQTQLPMEEIQLLYEFSRWPLDGDPKAAVSIFTGASHIHPDEVLKFLDTLTSHEAQMLYLEHLTLQGDCINCSEYIKRLIDLYITNDEHDRFNNHLTALLRGATANLGTSNLIRNLALAQKRAAAQKLLTGGHYTVWATRTHGKARQARLTAQDRCKVCQKRFSNIVAVKVMPSNDVVHWGCVKEENSN